MLAGLVERYGLVACLSGRPGDGRSARRRRRRRALRRRARPRAGAGRRRVGGAARRVRRVGRLAARRTGSGSRSPSTTGRRRTWPRPESALRAVADRALAGGAASSLGSARARDPPARSRRTRGRRSIRLLGESDLRRALYAGDDTTDLDAFRGLDGLEVAVRIAVVSDEAPDELGRRGRSRRATARRRSPSVLAQL